MRSEEERSGLRREWAAAALLLALGALLRLWALGGLPYGLNQDEASAGYETFALLTRWLTAGRAFPKEVQNRLGELPKETAASMFMASIN